MCIRDSPVTAVFHGHAHHGRPEGRTRSNVPVYNVSISLMREVFPERPFRLIEVDLAAGLQVGDRRSGGDRRTVERESAAPRERETTRAT